MIRIVYQALARHWTTLLVFAIRWIVCPFHQAVAEMGALHVPSSLPETPPTFLRIRRFLISLFPRLPARCVPPASLLPTSWMSRSSLLLSLALMTELGLRLPGSLLG